MGKVSKKLCVIVGVGPGMGLAIAKRFGKNDFKIAMIARSQDKLDSYKDDLSKYGIESAGYACDVSDLDSLGHVLDNIKEDIGSAEVFVYNVSILNPAAPQAVNLDSFVKDFKVNVVGALLSYQKMVPQMKGNKEACIIITGGGLSTDPYFEFTSLGVGKAGLRNLAMSLSQEGANMGLRVVTITIKGMIKKGTFYDPEKISLEFWKIYKNKPQRKDSEVVFEQES